MTQTVQSQPVQTTQTPQKAQETRKKMITEVFCDGIGKGWNISVKFMTPNIIMAFVLIKFLNHSGLMDILGDLFAPVMSVFGLPGEAATILIGAWLSIGGGVGIAAALFEGGTLTITQLAIVTPCIFIMGSQIQHMGRMLGVVGITKYPKELAVTMALPVFWGLFSLFMMRFIVG